MLKIPITIVLVVLYDMQCTFVTSNLVRPLILPLKGVTNKVGLCSGRGRKWWKFLKWWKIGHLGTLSKKLHIYMLAIFLKFGRKSENNSYHLILETYSEYIFYFYPFRGSKWRTICQNRDILTPKWTFRYFIQEICLKFFWNLVESRKKIVTI